jgi:hypothetical protein
MNAKWKTGGLALLGILVAAGTASAQTLDMKDRVRLDAAAPEDLAPATHSVELTVATGYEQGFGKVQLGKPTLTDLGQAGGAVQVGAGFRIIPQLTLGLYGSFAGFGRGAQVDSTASLYTTAAGVQADWHFLPGGFRVDPWVSLGSGWRGYWVGESAGNTSNQGMELAKLQVGVDYRLSRDVAISPVVGADLSSFFAQRTPDSDGWTSIAKPQVSTFFFAGLMGRFDIPTGWQGSRVASR